MGMKEKYKAMAAALYLGLLEHQGKLEKQIKTEGGCCEDCKLFPNPPKTFCKKAGHHVNKKTNAGNCKHFEYK